MHTKTIPHASFLELLNKQLYTCTGNPGSIEILTPSGILDALQKAGISYNLILLHFWERWEYGAEVVDEAAFLNATLGSLSNSEEEVILLFDDCFKTKEAYRLPANELITFAAGLPADSTLFQPLDHIFYFPSSAVLILVHHEGWMIRLNLQ